MTENSLHDITEDNKDVEKRNSLIGTTQVLIGCLAVVGAFEGAEVVARSDVLGSVNLGDSAAIITHTHAEIGLGLIASAGVALIAHGVKFLHHSR